MYKPGNDRMFSVDNSGSAEIIDLGIYIELDGASSGLPFVSGALLSSGVKKVWSEHNPYIVDFPDSRILNGRTYEWHQFDDPMTLTKAAEFILNSEIKR